MKLHAGITLDVRPVFDARILQLADFLRVMESQPSLRAQNETRFKGVRSFSTDIYAMHDCVHIAQRGRLSGSRTKTPISQKSPKRADKNS